MCCRTPGRRPAAAPGPDSYLRLVQRHFHIEHGLFRRLEYGVEAAQNGHRQDDISILAADVQIPEDVIGDAPDKVGDPVQLTLFHISPRGLQLSNRPSTSPLQRWAATS